MPALFVGSAVRHVPRDDSGLVVAIHFHEEWDAEGRRSSRARRAIRARNDREDIFVRDVVAECEVGRQEKNKRVTNQKAPRAATHADAAAANERT